jgi:hypothetical protein
MERSTIMLNANEIRDFLRNNLHRETATVSLSNPAQERLPTGIVVVVNEAGLAEYRRRHADGHLGAVED